MEIRYVPLLHHLRRLYSLPRDSSRFQAYVRTMVNDRGDDLGRFPLVMANPMGREPVRDLVEGLMAIGADRIAEEALQELAPELDDVHDSFPAAIMVVDDLYGGWTNRFATELGSMQVPDPAALPPAHRSRFWITGILWSSEPASETNVRTAIRTAAARVRYACIHGKATTLADLLRQESYVARIAGIAYEPLNEPESEWARFVIEEHAAADDIPTFVACLFGDAAARTLGMPPLGMPPRAGLRLRSVSTSSASAY